MAQIKHPGEGKPKPGGLQDWPSRVKQIRQQAEQNLADGAVTPAYKANREQIIDLLNRALTAEWTSFLQYWHHYTMASDLHSSEIADVWKEHAEEEYQHAQRLNARINELGGVPANSPNEIAQLSPISFEKGHDLRNMLEADLIAERQAIQLYNDIVRTCGFDDNETRAIFEDVLLVENEHANELASFLYQYDASTGQQIDTGHEAIIGQRPVPYRKAAS